MAAAKIRFIKQAKPVEYVEIPDGVELSLTKAEAQTLADILDFVGGDPTLSRRRYSDAIKNVLSAAGFSAPWNPTRKLPGVQDIDRSMEHYRGIYFMDIIPKVAE